MADERILAPIRRYWTTEQIDEAYQQIFAIDWALIKTKTIIVGKASESESANAQVAVSSETALEWMAAFEAILVERANTAAGITSELEGVGHVDFSRKFPTY